MAKRTKEKPENPVMADYAWKQTGGEDFHADDLNSGKMDIRANEVRSMLKSLIRAGYLIYSRGEEKPYSWTPKAKMIKADGTSFVNQQPTSPMKEIGLAGVAAVITGATATSGSKLASPAAKPKSGEDRAPRRRHVRKQADPTIAPDLLIPQPRSPFLPGSEEPPALDNFGQPLLTAPEGVKDIQAPPGWMDIHGPVVGDSPAELAVEVKLYGVPPEGANSAAVPETRCGSVDLFPSREKAKAMDIPTNSLLSRILTVEEIAVFDLLGDVTTNYLAADFFQDLGLEDVNLNLFLAKMYRLCILADGPKVVGQEKVYVFSRLAYDQYAGNFFQLSTSTALDKIRADLQKLRDQQADALKYLEEITTDAALTEHDHHQSVAAHEAAEKELVEAKRRLEQAEKDLEFAILRMEEAGVGLQAAKALVEATEQGIAAVDFDNRIAELSALEETAARMEQLHPEAYQLLLMEYLLIPVGGKEAE